MTIRETAARLADELATAPRKVAAEMIEAALRAERKRCGDVCGRIAREYEALECGWNGCPEWVAVECRDAILSGGLN